MCVAVQVRIVWALRGPVGVSLQVFTCSSLSRSCSACVCLNSWYKVFYVLPAHLYREVTAALSPSVTVVHKDAGQGQR